LNTINSKAHSIISYRYIRPTNGYMNS